MVKYKNLEFNNGKFSYDDIEGFILPTDILALFQSLILFNDNLNVKKLFYELGLDLARNFKLDETIFLTSYKLKEFINKQNFGEFEILQYNLKDKIIILKVFNEAFALSVRKNLRIQKNEVNYILCGVIAGIFQTRFNEEIICKEIQNIAQGKLYSIYRVEKKL